MPSDHHNEYCGTRGGAVTAIVRDEVCQKRIPIGGPRVSQYPLHFPLSFQIKEGLGSLAFSLPSLTSNTDLVFWEQMKETFIICPRRSSTCLDIAQL